MIKKKKTFFKNLYCLVYVQGKLESKFTLIQDLLNRALNNWRQAFIPGEDSQWNIVVNTVICGSYHDRLLAEMLVSLTSRAHSLCFSNEKTIAGYLPALIFALRKYCPHLKSSSCWLKVIFSTCTN